HGGPIVAPIQDIVLGMYYLTEIRDSARGAGSTFSTVQEAKHAHLTNIVHLHAPINVTVDYMADDGERMYKRIENTTMGRIYLNDALPPKLRYRPDYTDKTMVKGDIAKMISECYTKYGSQRTIELLDAVKNLGFKFSSFSGTTVSMTDMAVPPER